MIDDQKLPSYDTFHVVSAEALSLPSYDAAVEPRVTTSRPLTTHTYSLKPKPHTEITLSLSTSHAPDPSKLALFFFPTAIAGDVKLNLGKTTSIRKISVYVSGVVLTLGLKTERRSRELTPISAARP